MRKNLLSIRLFLSLMMVLSISEVIPTGWPYQKQHLFSGKHAKPYYYFMGYMTNYSSEKYSFVYNGQKLVDLSPGKPVLLFNQILNHWKNWDEVTLFDRSKNNHTHDYSLFPSDNKYPTVKIHTTTVGPVVTIYVGIPSGTITIDKTTVKAPTRGLKIIFNTTNFEYYITQTDFHNHLKINDIKGWALGLAVDPDKIALIDPKNLDEILKTLNISAIWNNNNIIEITKLLKINESYLKQYIPYADLFATPNPAIEIQPLTERDAKNLKWT